MSQGITRLTGMSVNRLENYQKNMEDNSHLSSSNTKTIYTKKNGNALSPNHTETGWFARSRIGDTKRDIFSTLKSYIGKKAANNIFNKNSVKRFNGTRVGGQKHGFTIKSDVFSPNGRAVTKDTLGKMLSDAKKEKVKQNISAMTPAQRTEKAGKMRQLEAVGVLKDAQLGPEFKMWAEAENSAENIPFLMKCEDYKELLAEYDKLETEYTARDGKVHDVDNKLAAKVNEIRAKVREIKQMADTGEFNVGGSSVRRLGQKVRQKPIDQMNIGDLQKLYRGADPSAVRADTGPIGSMRRAVRGNTQNSLDRFITALDDKQLSISDQQAANADDAMTSLRNLKTKMSDDEHLRTDTAGATLFAKTSHGAKGDKIFSDAKVRLWTSGRAKRFEAAKQEVKRVITDSIGDAAIADKIMQPYLKSSRALSKADLTRIINQADAFKLMRSKVDTLKNSDSPNVPSTGMMMLDSSEAYKNKNAAAPEWLGAFEAFCDAKGSDALSTPKKITDLRRRIEELKESPTPGKLNAARNLAKQLLDQKNLPSDLRNQLNRFLGPPRSNTRNTIYTQTNHELGKFRAELTGVNSEVGKLHSEFKSYVEQQKQPPEQPPEQQYEERIGFGGMIRVPVKPSNDSPVQDSNPISSNPTSDTASESGSSVSDYSLASDLTHGSTIILSEKDGASVNNANQFMAARESSPEPVSSVQAKSVQQNDGGKQVSAASSVSSSESSQPTMRSLIRDTLVERFQAIGYSASSPSFQGCLDKIVRAFELNYPDGQVTKLDIAEGFSTGSGDITKAMMEAFATERAIKGDDPNGLRTGMEQLVSHLDGMVQDGWLVVDAYEKVDTVEEMLADARDALDNGDLNKAHQLFGEARDLGLSLISQAILERESTLSSNAPN